eukprot:3150097-Rhodomonas_salina.1
MFLKGDIAVEDLRPPSRDRRTGMQASRFLDDEDNNRGRDSFDGGGFNNLQYERPQTRTICGVSRPLVCVGGFTLLVCSFIVLVRSLLSLSATAAAILIAATVLGTALKPSHHKLDASDYANGGKDAAGQNPVQGASNSGTAKDTVDIPGDPGTARSVRETSRLKRGWVLKGAGEVGNQGGCGRRRATASSQVIPAFPLSVRAAMPSTHEVQRSQFSSSFNFSCTSASSAAASFNYSCTSASSSSAAASSCCGRLPSSWPAGP